MALSANAAPELRHGGGRYLTWARFSLSDILRIFSNHRLVTSRGFMNTKKNQQLL
jgi:hypothetical protein